MLLILVSCVESVVLSRVLKLHITTQYIVRRHSLRYGYMDHPFGSECPNILHKRIIIDTIKNVLSKQTARGISSTDYCITKPTGRNSSSYID